MVLTSKEKVHEKLHALAVLCESSILATSSHRAWVHRACTKFTVPRPLKVAKLPHGRLTLYTLPTLHRTNLPLGRLVPPAVQNAPLHALASS
eukprot:5665470-Amphidinium_carterae.1